jgi:hypothetical protein
MVDLSKFSQLIVLLLVGDIIRGKEVIGEVLSSHLE